MWKFIGLTVLLSNYLLSGPQFSTSPMLPSGQVGSSYSAQILVTGAALGGTPSWNLAAGILPYGVGLGPGVIGGTPTTAGTFAVEVSFSDNINPSVSQIFTLFIASQLSATGSSLPVDVVGTAGLVVGVSGGIVPYTFSVQSGSLPHGLKLNSDGSTAGLRDQPGVFSYTLLITDSTGASLVESITETVEATPLQIAPPLARFRAGLPYRFPIEAGHLPTRLPVRCAIYRLIGVESRPGWRSYAARRRPFSYKTALASVSPC